MLKKGLLLFCIVLLVSCAIQKVAFAKIDMQLVPDTSNQKSFLLVQVADSAELKTVPGQKDHYTLTMSGLHPHVMYFSAHPKHKAGMITIEKFFELWNQARTQNTAGHANAGMIGATFDAVGKKGIKSGFLALSNAQYSATTNSVQYDVLPQKDEFHVQPGKYHEASLFIYEVIFTGKKWKLVPIQ